MLKRGLRTQIGGIDHQIINRIRIKSKKTK